VEGASTARAAAEEEVDELGQSSSVVAAELVDEDHFTRSPYRNGANH